VDRLLCRSPSDRGQPVFKMISGDPIGKSRGQILTMDGPACPAHKQAGRHPVGTPAARSHAPSISRQDRGITVLQFCTSLPAPLSTFPSLGRKPAGAPLCGKAGLLSSQVVSVSWRMPFSKKRLSVQAALTRMDRGTFKVNDSPLNATP
jgi:hypothetical protein